MPLTITINEAAPGTLTIGVGTPGVGVPTGGTAGQVLTKVDSTDYNTVFATPSADFITAVTAPLAVASGNLTVNLAAYLTTATAASTYQTLAGMSSYLTTATAATTYYLQTNPAGYQTAGDLSSALSTYLLSSTAASTYYPLVGNPSGFLTSAPVTSVAGMTGAVVLANTDISGLGTMSTATAADYSTTAAANGLYYPLSGNPSAFLTDAPSDGSTYGRNNGAWAVAGGAPFITSVSAPLNVTSNDLSVDLTSKLSTSGGTMTGTILLPHQGPGVDSELSGSGLLVEYTQDNAQFSRLDYNLLTINSSLMPSVSMSVSTTGLTFPDATTQTTAGYPLSSNPSGFLTDAPSDGSTYGRNNAVWSQIISGVPEAPQDGSTYARLNASWSAIIVPPSPPYNNSAWSGGTYVSASVTNIYDTGSSQYYNVLTF